VAMQLTLAIQPAPGAAANEDFVAAAPEGVVVLDGASVSAGLEIGCHHGTAWFVQQLGTTLLTLLVTEPDRPLAAVLGQAIGDVAGRHAGICDLAHPGTPSAAVAILRERRQLVDYLVLADAIVVLDLPGGVQVVTDDRLAQLATVEHAAMHQQPTGTAVHRQRYAELMAELQRQRNSDDGYWVASSNPEAAVHALTGTVNRGGLRRAAVLTDGATRLADRFGLLDWAGLLDVLQRNGPASLIEQVRDAERSDPEGRRWPRSKRHDDATAVFCRFA
jgi:hypothetical protein